MLTWAKRVTRGSNNHDMLELYCGNGNFTIALAPNFRQAPYNPSCACLTLHHVLAALFITLQWPSYMFSNAWHLAPFHHCLPTCYRKVVATELSKASVAAAEFNLQANNVSNVSIARLSAEDFTAAWRGKIESKRAEGLNLKEHDLRTILVDPPRAGLKCFFLAETLHATHALLRHGDMPYFMKPKSSL